MGMPPMATVTSPCAALGDELVIDCRCSTMQAVEEVYDLMILTATITSYKAPFVDVPPIAN